MSEAHGDPARVLLPRIARLFRPYRAQLALLAVLTMAGSLIVLIPPFLLRAILDVALPHQRTGLLTALAAGMLGLAAAATVVGVWQAYLSLTVAQEIMNDLRTSVYAHLQRMSLAFFTRTRTGEVQSRIGNDIGGVGSVVTSVATTVVGGLATIVGSLAAMIGLSWRLTVVSLLMLPAFVVISRRIGRERRVLTGERQERLAMISTLVEESLSINGFLLGRVLDRSRVLNQEFTQQSRSLTGLTIASSMAGRWRQSVIAMIVTAMPVAIYWAAGVTAHHGHMAISIGTLVAFTSLQQGLFGPSTQVLQAAVSAQSSLAIFGRIFAYLDLPIDMHEPAHPVPLSSASRHVRFEGVAFAYGDHEILRDIDIDLPPGRHLAVVGPTGAGKTTLGYLVPRLYDVTGGRVTINGVDVRDLSFATLAETVGVVSQDTCLFHATVADNLRFARPGATDAELAAAARIAQIHDLIASLPQGYQTIVGERGYRFSGGEKQRLAIARIVLRDPPVLVLDEATSALDSRTERSVQRALDRLSAGRTTITITHRLSTIRHADEIVVLHGGRITERGTNDELVSRNGYYARFTAANSRSL